LIKYNPNGGTKNNCYYNDENKDYYAGGIGMFTYNGGN